jgi:hypothetical protein
MSELQILEGRKKITGSIPGNYLIEVSILFSLPLHILPPVMLFFKAKNLADFPV